jgi:hypothetical protein
VYRDADVNAVALLGSQLYVGLASDDPVLTTPALLEELKYTEGLGLEQTGRWLQMPSWAVTDLAIQGDAVAAAVGAQGGGVVMVRRSGTSMSVDGFAAGVDSRGVAWDGNSAIMSVCGAPGLLRRSGAPDL